MATGFSETEYRLARMVSLALSRGVPESAFGLGGMRTVGPCVTMSAKGYRTNGTPGMELGKTFRDAVTTIRTIYLSHTSARAILSRAASDDEIANRQDRDDYSPGDHPSYHTERE